MRNSLLCSFDRHPWRWLLLGAALLILSELRFGLGVLAWIAPVPWLRYTRLDGRWRARLMLLVAGIVAWMAAVAKILTAPLPPVLAAAFGAPIGLVLTLPYLLAPALRRHGERAYAVGFAALMVCAEWCLHALTPFGVWGDAANTQLDRLALLQLASITGLQGVGFLVYLVAGAVDVALHDGRRLRPLGVALACVVLAVAGGQARLALLDVGQSTVRVAAVGTDSRVGREESSVAQERAVREVLFSRTRRAAAAGAKLVVWTEAATQVEPAEESAFLDELGALARRAQATIVAGYVVPLSRDPLRYRNRYAWVTPRGVDHIYDKHRPVPGEPAVAGEGPTPLVRDPHLGRASGAICYDYDFPRLALEHGELGVDLVALPASDWRGIDPIHTRMASLRAIESGHALVRSTRFGLSAVYDAHGRTLAQRHSFGGGEPILLADVPRRGVRTVYSWLGDWFPLTCFGFVAALLLRRLYHRWPWTPFSRSRAAPSSTPARRSGSTSTSC